MMNIIPSTIGLRVMAEYGSSGIWQFVHDETGPWQHSMIEYQRLGLSEDLKDSFKKWISSYEQNNIQGELDHIAFNATGLSLAYELYIHLNKENYVEYQGESEDGGLEETINIGCL